MYLTNVENEVAGADGLWSPSSAGAARWLASPEHDHIVDIARNLFHCPSASITLEESRAFYADGSSFTQVAVASRGPLVVEDTLHDSRFCDAVMVRAYPHIRYYVGTGIRLTTGATVGTLAVMDYIARDRPSDSELAALDSLAALAADYIEKAMSALARPAQAAQFDFLVERSPTGVMTLGMDGRIVGVNRAAQRLLRTSAAGIVGREADDHVIGWRLLVDDHRNAIDLDQGQRLRTILVEVLTSDGAIVPALASLSAWLVGGATVYRLLIDELP